MKTIKFSLLAFLCLFIASCSSDDTPNTDSSMVTGTWNLEAFDYSGETTGNFDGMDISAAYQGLAKNIDATLSFNSDNTFDFQGDYDVELTTGGMTQVVPMEDVSSSGTWRIEGNNLITSGAVGQVQGEGVQGPQESIMRISEVSESRMVLLVDQEDKITEGGMEFTMVSSARYILSR